MAVVGQRIAAVCEDNTINVYDAVTGVPRLTLEAPQRVTNVAGSPDGSILFCAHQRFHEITLWDMQTGGLIHTFTMKSEISNIAVSLAGRYLAGCSYDGTFEFWDVDVRRRGRVKDLPSSVSRTCWIGQQDCIEQTRLQYGNVGRT
jgi:WD40 repeat protein